MAVVAQHSQAKLVDLEEEILIEPQDAVRHRLLIRRHTVSQTGQREIVQQLHTTAIVVAIRHHTNRHKAAVADRLQVSTEHHLIRARTDRSTAHHRIANQIAIAEAHHSVAIVAVHRVEVAMAHSVVEAEAEEDKF